MSGKNVKAGGASVRLFTDNNPLKKGLQAASKQLKTWSAGISKAGAVVGGLGASVMAPLMASTVGFASAGAALSKSATSLQMRTEDLSNLSYAAEQVGASASDMEGALGAVRDKLTDAAMGSGEANAAFAKLGLSAGQLAKMDPGERFRLLAAQLGKVRNPMLQAALAQQVFGSSADAMLPLIRKGADGLRELEAEAGKLGATVSGEDAEAASMFTRGLLQIRTAIGGVTSAIGAALAPGLAVVASRIASLMAGIGSWINQNRPLIVTIFKVAAGVMAAGAAIAGLGMAGMAIAAVLSGLGTVVGILGAAFGLVLKAVLFLVSPFGLLIAAAAGLAYYFGAAGAVMDWLKEKFSSLAEFATNTFGAIAKALANGRIDLAAQVLWTSLQLAWKRGTTALYEIWLTVKDWFQSVWASAVFGAARIAIIAWDGLKSGFRETVNLIADLWSMFAGGLVKTWHTTIGFIKSAWVRLKSLFSSDINVDAEVNRINNETAAKNAAVDNQSLKAIGDRDASSRKEAAQIAADQQSTLAELERAKIEETAARQKNRDALLAKSAEELKEAQDAYGAVLEDVADLPLEASSMFSIPAFAAPEAAKLGGIPAGVSGMGYDLSKATSVGTFSGAAAGGLVSSSFEKQIAANTAATAKYTRELATKTDTDSVA